jgi:hypothetical protein
MPSTDLGQSAHDAAVMLTELTPSICQELQRMANPDGLTRLSEERLEDVKLRLHTTCKILQKGMNQATLVDSKNVMQLHEALKAASETIELLHQAH